MVMSDLDGFGSKSNEDLGPLAASKHAEREELNRQIEAFLAAGGTIDYVEPNILADPPKRPTSNYGSQPI